MIDLKDQSFTNLRKTEEYSEKIIPILIGTESILGKFKSKKKIIFFSNHRVIIISTKGFAGKKSDVTSIVYSKVSAISGTIFSSTPVIEIYIFGIGKLTFEFTSECEINDIYKVILEATTSR